MLPSFAQVAALYLGAVAQPAPAVALPAFKPIAPQSYPQKLCIDTERIYLLIKTRRGDIF